VCPELNERITTTTRRIVFCQQFIRPKNIFNTFRHLFGKPERIQVFSEKFVGFRLHFWTFYWMVYEKGFHSVFWAWQMYVFCLVNKIRGGVFKFEPLDPLQYAFGHFDVKTGLFWGYHLAMWLLMKNVSFFWILILLILRLFCKPLKHFAVSCCFHKSRDPKK